MKEYLQTTDAVLDKVGSSGTGLTGAEAAARLEKNGKNKLAEGKRESVILRFLKQLVEPMTIILLVAAAISAVLAVYEGSFPSDVVIIMAVVVINAVLGVVQESKAEEAIAALQEMSAATSKVLRDGKQVSVHSEDLVVGDVIILEAGDAVPADARLLECASMKVEEAALTGESVPVVKTAESLSAGESGDVPLGDRINMGFMGATVVYGRGKAVITATGMGTEMGKIASALSQAEEGKTPLQIKLSQLSRILTYLVVGICVVIFAVNLAGSLITNGSGNLPETILNTFMIAVSLAVAAIPEGLSTVVTIVLSIGVTKMSRRHAVIRRLTAVETLGCAGVICSDKTGTITEGEPKVTDVIPAGNITEDELLFLAVSLEAKSEHPLAKAIIRRGEELSVKPEEVMEFEALPGNGLHAVSNGKLLLGGSLRFLSEQTGVSKELRKQAEELAEQGKTPLLFAQDGRMLGIIAVADTMKEDSPKAIQELRKLGIRVIMLTGDNERTANAIGRKAGVDEVVAGVLPDGKESVIRELKEQGVTAMVGDGINDAPALTRADVGIAIGAGADVAIDAADVVLMKSHLSDVPAAIRLSRATLRNIHENLFWAFIYNIIGIPLAAGCFVAFGLTLNPMFGAAAMSLSSFCVVSNALRLNLCRVHDGSHDRPFHKKIPKTAQTAPITKTVKIKGMMCEHCKNCFGGTAGSFGSSCQP